MTSKNRAARRAAERTAAPAPEPEQGGDIAVNEEEGAPPETERVHEAGPAASDLSDLRAQLEETLPPPPPRPESSATPGSGEEGEGGEEELITELKDIAADPSKIDALSAEELADLYELVFGLIADERGSHWEVERKRALRLGEYTRKTMDQYGGVPESWAKHIPAIILAVLLGATVYRRVKIDQSLARPPLTLHADRKDDQEVPS